MSTHWHWPREAREIQGDHAFAVATFTQGSELVDPTTMAPASQGDPDQAWPRL
jgi:hypothetical protein